MGLLVYAEQNHPTDRIYDNIYAIAREGKVYITSRSANISLFHVNEQFADRLVAERVEEMGGNVSESVADVIREKITGRTRIVEDGDGNFSVERVGGVDASFHFLVDLVNGDTYIMGASFPVGSYTAHENAKIRELIMGKVSEWLKQNRGVERMRIVKDVPIPHQDYSVSQLRDLPGVVNYIERNKLNLHVDGTENVFMVDMSSKRMRDLVMDQLDYQEEGFISDRPFIYQYENKPLFRVDPPFLLINSDGRTMLSMSRAICSVLVDHYSFTSIAEAEDKESMSTEAIEMMRKKITMDIDVGRSIGDCMHDEIQSTMTGNNILASVQMAHIDDIIKRFGAEGDQQMELFIKSFVSFISAFRSIEGDHEYGQYYYLTIAPEEVRYPELFNMIFVISSSMNSDNGRYDCLMSKYSIPYSALKLFGYKPLTTVSYDKKMNVLLRSMEHSQEAMGSMSEMMDNIMNASPEVRSSMESIFVNSVKRFNAGAANMEVHVDRPGMVKMLSDFPMVFSYVKDMFADAGIDYDGKDIPVTIMYDSSRPKMRGAYSLIGGGNAYYQESETIFSPPEITINTADMASVEDIAETLLHEASHYLDDVKTQMGIEPSDFMSKPAPQGAPEEEYWRGYLSGDPTEFRAHTAMIVLDLMQMDRNFVAANQDALKLQYVRKILVMGASFETFPLGRDANSGDDTIFVPPNPSIKPGGVFTIAEQNDVENYFLTGLKRHETISIRDIDGEGNITLAAPIHDDYLVSNGAMLRSPISDVHGVVEELYGDIVNTAFAHYLAGGDVRNVPSEPIVE